MRNVAWVFGIGLSILSTIFCLIAYVVIENSHPRRSNRSMYLSILADLNIVGDLGKIDVKKKSPGGSNRIRCVGKYDIKQFHEADVNECDFTQYSDAASNTCPIFSVGNTCIAIMVPNYIYRNKDAYSRVENVIREPCKFVRKYKSELISRDAIKVFGCDKKREKPRYSVYVIIFNIQKEENVSDKNKNPVLKEVEFYSNKHSYYLLSIRGFFHFIY